MAQGVLLTTGAGLALDLIGSGVDGFPVAVAPAHVRLSGPNSVLSALLGRAGSRVTVSGRWDGEQLRVVEVSGSAEVGEPPQAPAGVQRPESFSAELQKALRVLSAEGTLLWCGTPPGGRLTAATTDPVRTAELLVPLVGHRLVVRHSPWSPHDLSTLQDAVEQMAGAELLEGGQQLSRDGHVRVTASLRCLTPQAAGGLEGQLLDALLLTVRLSPLR